MQLIWALVTLGAPLLSSAVVCRHLGRWESRVLGSLCRIVVYSLLVLLPIHLLAAVELLGLLDSFSLLHTAIANFLILGALVSWDRTGGTTSGRAGPSSEGVWSAALAQFRRTPRYILWGGSILVLCYLAFAVDLLSSFPQGRDGIYYRLPLAVRWLQEGSLAIPASHAWRYGMPDNPVIPIMVLLGIGWQPLSILFDLVPLAALLASTYLIARRCGATQEAAAVSTLILLSVPVVTFQAFVAYVELFHAGFFLAGVTFFLYRHPRDRAGSSASFLTRTSLAGLACGIAVGSKAVYWVYGALFFLFALVVLAVERRKHRVPVVMSAGLLAGAMLVPSVFWFARAFFATGNPFFPVQLEAFGISLAGVSTAMLRPPAQYLDWVPHPLAWFLYPWTEGNVRGLHYSYEGGLGAGFATFVPLGLAYGLLRVFRRYRGRAWDVQLSLLLAFGIGLLTWFLGLGMSLRFGIPLIALACALAAPMIDRLVGARSRVFGSLVVGSVLITCSISAFSPLRGLLGRAYVGEWSRAQFYRYPEMIDDLPEGSTILNLGRFYLGNFALSGKHLTNRVIPMFECPLMRRPEGFLDPYASREFLVENEIDFIAQMRDDHTGPPLTGEHPLEGPGLDEEPYPTYLEPGVPLELVFEESPGQQAGGAASLGRKPAGESPWRIWRVLDPGEQVPRMAQAEPGVSAAPMNVILISVDTLRADHMGVYGYGRETTPNLDAFFGDKTVFENAQATAPCTIPSVLQFMDGNLDYGVDRESLTEVLGHHGYLTAAVVSQQLFGNSAQPNKQYSRGFDHFDVQDPAEQDHHKLTTRNATEVTDRAIDWLDDNASEGAFFLWLHYFDPHDPYEPPPAFRVFDSGESKYEDGDRRRYFLDEYRRLGRRPRYEDLFTRQDNEHFVALYDGEIRYADDEIGRFLETLDRQGLVESSIVVLTSDHGELLGEEGRWDHCESLSQEELHVPLLISAGGERLGGKHRVAAPASTLDIVPTVLGALGLSYAPVTLDGIDLAKRPHPRSILAIWKGVIAVRQGNWKLLAKGERAVALFDLDSAEGERRDLRASQEEIVSSLLREVRAARFMVEDVQTRLEDTIERLKSIGYIN